MWTVWEAAASEGPGGTTVPQMQGGGDPKRTLSSSSRTAAAAARGDQSIMISIMMRLTTSALRLLVIVIRAASTAAGAVFKETRSFSTEHSLQRWSGRVFSRTTGRRYKPSLFGQTMQPALHCIASVLRTHYSIKENTHLCAGTER